jgi:hypothetical protein
MAERIVSPGVFTREQDTSFLTPAPAEVSTAVVGPTVKGPIDIPTVVRSYGEYVAVYGDRFQSGSQYYQHLTSLAAEKYFEQGGDSLLVTRVAPSGYSEATATVSSGSTDFFTLQTIGEGDLFNSTGPILTDSALASGSAENVRWEVTGVNSTRGTFDLVIRRGDDTIKSKTILETYNNLSLDPNSDDYISKRIGDVSYSVNGSDIIESGDYPNRSSYVRVSNVSTIQVDYLDNSGAAKTEYKTVWDNFNLTLGNGYSGSAAGAFSGGAGALDTAGANFFDAIDNVNTQGLEVTAGAVDEYDNAAAVLGNREAFNFNVLLTPGLNQEDHATTLGTFIDLVEDRGDAIHIADLTSYGSLVSTAVTEATELNSSFAAAYWPWVKVQAQGIGRQVWAPASTVMGGVLAFNDSVSAEWFAPAGLIRGGIPGVIRAERKLSRTDRDSLYQGKVNPLATFPGSGVVAYGQKTLQTKASALDRVNVRRLLITLKRFVSDQSNNLVFEQNTIATRNRFLSIVNPYMENVIQRQGLYAFRVVMDDTNNTADVIDRNQLVGQIFIQPTKTAEFIVLDFVVEPTGAAFGA